MEALDKLLEYAICGLAHNNHKTDIAREWKKEVESKIGGGEKVQVENFVSLRRYYWLLQKKRGRCGLPGGGWSTIYGSLEKSKVNKKFKKIGWKEPAKYRILTLYRKIKSN